MGASRAKRKAFFQQHPFCCFCGGSEPAETIDHLPGSNFFDDKQRPEGLEFPACQSCNSLSSKSEQVISLLARTKLGADSPSDLMRNIREIYNNSRDVYDEIVTGKVTARNQIKRVREIIGETEDFILVKFGDTCHRHCSLFGAKMALALHYVIFDRPIPQDGGVISSYQNQYGILTGQMPKLDIPFSNFTAMQSGKRNSIGQFEWRFARVPGHEVAVTQFLLRRNMLFTAFTTSDRSLLTPTDGDRWSIPGHLEPVPASTEIRSLHAVFDRPIIAA